MVHPYLRRRDGLEPVRYPSEAVKTVLAKTLGVPIFQEQVMKLAVVAAGFTPGEADKLRRSMAAWRRNGTIEQFQMRLIKGMLANGYPKKFAEQIYLQIRGFGEYGFPESHSASFSLLVYASAWLKRHHPAAFCAAMLNSQPLGFYTPGQLVRDALAHGVAVFPVDVNHSNWDCTLETSQAFDFGLPIVDCPVPRSPSPDPRSPIPDPRSPLPAPRSWGRGGPAVRLGMRLVRGLSEEKARGIVVARTEGAIDSIRRLSQRGDVSRETLLRLAAADAFRSLGLDRRRALWMILALDRDPDAGPGALTATPSLLADLELRERPVALPKMPLDETVVQDYDAIGFSLNAHPIGLVRRELAALRRAGIGERGSGSGDRGSGSGERGSGIGDRGAGQSTIGNRQSKIGQVRAFAPAGSRGLVPVVPNDRLRHLRNGQRVAVAGLVTCRQRPGTAKGIVFITLEDETGMANLVVKPEVWQTYGRIAKGKIALVATGHIERKNDVIHVMVRRIDDLSKMLGALAHRSRDFH